MSLSIPIAKYILLVCTPTKRPYYQNQNSFFLLVRNLDTYSIKIVGDKYENQKMLFSRTTLAC
jgi:hypothetical protein